MPGTQINAYGLLRNDVAGHGEATVPYGDAGMAGRADDDS